MTEKKTRALMSALALALAMIMAAPAAAAHTEVRLVAYVCNDLGTETVRVGPDGTVHIRGMVTTGESESEDPRFDGFFRRTSNIDLYPDGSGVSWGVHDQRSHTYEGAWKVRFRVPFDASGFVGHGRAVGQQAFAGLVAEGAITPPTGPIPPSPCNPLIEVSEFNGVVFD